MHLLNRLSADTSDLLDELEQAKARVFELEKQYQDMAAEVGQLKDRLDTMASWLRKRFGKTEANE